MTHVLDPVKGFSNDNEKKKTKLSHLLFGLVFLRAFFVLLFCLLAIARLLFFVMKAWSFRVTDSTYVEFYFALCTALCARMRTISKVVHEASYLLVSNLYNLCICVSYHLTQANAFRFVAVFLFVFVVDFFWCWCEFFSLYSLCWVICVNNKKPVFTSIVSSMCMGSQL